MSFIQAYVFTLLSALFIAMAQEKGEKHKAEGDEMYPERERHDREDIKEEEAVLGRLAKEIDR